MNHTRAFVLSGESSSNCGRELCRKAWGTPPASLRWKEGMAFGDGEVRPGTDDRHGALSDARPNIMCGDHPQGCVQWGAGHNDWSRAVTVSRHRLNSIMWDTARNQRVQGPSWQKLVSLCSRNERAPTVVPPISGALCIYTRGAIQC